MTTVCQECGEKSWNISFFSAMYRCVNCLKLFHGKCLENRGIGVVRRGHCPYCGAALQLSHRLDESRGSAEDTSRGETRSTPAPNALTATRDESAGSMRDSQRDRSISGTGIVITIAIGLAIAIGLVKTHSPGDGSDNGKLFQMAAIQSAIRSHENMCTSNGVNLRRCASRKCAVLLELPEGARVDMKKHKGMWVQVDYADGSSSVTTGYISGELLKPCD